MSLSVRSSRPPVPPACPSSSSAPSSRRSSRRRRALCRGHGGRPGQDRPVGQHRDRLERPDRAVRGSGPVPGLVRPRPGADGDRFNGYELAASPAGRRRPAPPSRAANRPGTRVCSDRPSTSSSESSSSPPERYRRATTSAGRRVPRAHRDRNTFSASPVPPRDDCRGSIPIDSPRAGGGGGWTGRVDEQVVGERQRGADPVAEVGRRGEPRERARRLARHSG